MFLEVRACGAVGDQVGACLYFKASILPPKFAGSLPCSAQRTLRTAAGPLFWESMSNDVKGIQGLRGNPSELVPGAAEVPSGVAGVSSRAQRLYKVDSFAPSCGLSCSSNLFSVSGVIRR